MSSEKDSHSQRASGKVAASPFEPRLLNIEDAAAYLAISPWTVRDLVAQGRLPFVRIGRRVLLKREDLDRYIDIQTRRAEE